MALFDRHCPVDARAQAWVQDSMRWFAGQFGAAMLDQPVVLPTHEFFPPPYQGGDENIRAAVRRVAGYMGLPAGQVTVRCTDGLDPAGEPGLPARADVHGTAGRYLRHSGQDVITIDKATAAQPAVLLAVIAHVRLLGENRISPGQRDGEQLAGLVTVYLGMGIFTATVTPPSTSATAPTAGRPAATPPSPTAAGTPSDSATWTSRCSGTAWPT